MILSNMSEIKLLSKDISNRIAAGEVVERPANAVKELIENALDAGADNITVEIVDGGIGLIRVIDNGKGILPEDMESSVLRFATSKISTIEDVYSINSFGFRGEALAAISSVSDFSLKSVRKGFESQELIIDKNGEPVIKPVSLAEGTIITVKNLFDRIPARKKFLKASSTEQREVAKMVRYLSMINPNVSMSLFVDGKKIYECFSSESMKDRAVRIFKENDLVTIENKYTSISIDAVVSLPNIQKFRKDQIIIAINGRLVKDNQLTYAVIQAYHRLLPSNRYPVAVISLDLDPSSIDVNIHPSKMSIKIFDSKDIFNFVYDSIKKGLEKVSIDDVTVPQSVEEIPVTVAPKIFEQKAEYSFDMTKSFESSPVNMQRDIKFVEKIDQGKQIFTPPQQETYIDFKVIGQLFKTVIVCEKDNEVYYFDQHIVHERILFENYKKNGLADVASIFLVEPLLIEFSDEDIYLALEHKDILEPFGFEVELFGTGSLKLLRVPTSILNKNIEDEFKSIIAEISHTRQRKEQDYAIVTMACKTAIKAGEELSHFEMEKLISDLFKTENPFTCPHGRPILFKMTKEDIYRKFQR